ncbi:uncharacterized protein LOC144108345 [Amblyomma americanum]
MVTRFLGRFEWFPYAVRFFWHVENVHVTSRRQSHCFVPGCTTGYKSCKEKLSLFGVPKDEELSLKWQRNIPRADKPLVRNAAVCKLHFDPQFVLRHFEHNIQGKTVRLERSRPVLQPDAVPTKFPNVPKYLSKPVPKKRNPKKRLDPQFVPSKRRRTVPQASDVSAEAPASAEPDILRTSDARNVTLPSDKWGKHVFFCEEPLTVSYSVCLPGPNMGLLHAQKLVLFRSEGTAVKHQVFVRGVELTAIDEKCDPASVLQEVDSMQVCAGAGLLTEFCHVSCSKMIKWSEGFYHKRCKGAVSENEMRCVACKYLRRLLINQRCREKKRNVSYDYGKKLRARTEAVRRLRAKVKNLDRTIIQMKQENEDIEESTVLKKIEKLPQKQRVAIMQCFEAGSRKSVKGMRYKPERMLECIIMHMKSARLYEHVRKQNILVLPSRTCLRKYMEKYESRFGFNAAVLSGISRKTQEMTEFECHGGLIVDEMKLAENFAVASGSGKVHGFVDLGPYTPEADKTVTCGHGLVIMFQPLSGS